MDGPLTVVALSEPERQQNNLTVLQTDQVLADRLRAELRPHAEAVAAAINRAKREHGLNLDVSFGRDGYGNLAVNFITVTRSY